MRRAVSLAALSLLAAAGGCGRDAPAPPQTASPAWQYEDTASDGPVSLVLRVDRLEAELSDTVLVEQELRVEPGFEAEFPEYLPEDFEGFTVTDIERPDDAPTPEPEPEEQEEEPKRARTLRKRLTLEPERSGELKIAPLAVYYHRSGEAEESWFLTKEVSIDVAPISNPGALDVLPARGIYDAPPAPPEDGRLVWLWVGAGAVVAIGLLAWLLRKRGTRLLPPVPPHEVAYEALRRLLALQLIEKGEIERFFVFLSAILREYIESRFGVHAPERTTEEFLEEATRHRALESHRARLGEFLRLCDQVKFARFQPDDSTIQQAFDVVKRFLAETTEAEMTGTETTKAVTTKAVTQATPSVSHDS